MIEASESPFAKNLVHVGANAVGHGLGDGARYAGRAGGKARKITTDAPKQKRYLHVQGRLNDRGQKVAAAGVLGGAATAVGGVDYAVSTEVNRHNANRKGGGAVSRGEAYRHPIRTAYAGNSAQQRRYADKTARRAPELSNRYAFASAANAAAASNPKGVRGVPKSDRRYDKSRKYEAPRQVSVGKTLSAADSPFAR